MVKIVFPQKAFLDADNLTGHERKLGKATKSNIYGPYKGPFCFLKGPRSL